MLDLDYGPPTKDVLRFDQTVPIKGLASQQSNYVDRAIRRIESAPLGPDITLIPRTNTTGQNGISIPKATFFMDQDPLSGSVIEHAKVVYRSEAVAQEAMADANAMSINIGLNYACYLRDGIIFPTILSETTIPNLMPYIRQKRDQDLADLKATADLAEALAWWYVGARFPIKVSPGTGTGRLIVASGRTLSTEEMVIAQMLVNEGRTVRALAASSRQGVRTADFIVDGVRTELKSISNLTSRDISGALGRRILEGAGQAPHVIADVRQQAGMTWDLAQRAIRRAFGADTARRIQQIRIIGRNFDTTVPRLP
ncbi:MAG: hypothetical protein JETT_3854 [Candidatus Jettenia ecosi]|uniref:tRNA nuclease CdiA C-terminal domain-containing protein n=1 Tax=Candidatus Jettenia ecosi TaxID=2494326 RepID=A0A533Q5Q9_9BACT|nr:MAG: hypothetical protein JETT_3854 [Candidatus Jettenia ecosi]